jgi:hypothetical protein
VFAADRGPGLRRGDDVLGAVLITGALTVTVYTVVSPTSPRLLLGAFATVLMGAFVVREATAAAPLVPLRIFRSRTLTGANLAQLASAAGMFGMFFVGVLYCQHVLGYGAMRIGLAFLPVTVVMGGLSLRYTEKLIGRYGARRLVITGLALVAAGLAYFARVPADGSYLTDVLPSMLLLGFGGGLAFPSLAALAMSDAKPEDAGLASGVFSTTAQVGSALGLAVLATLSATSFRTSFVAATVMVLVGLAVTLTRLKGSSRRSSEPRQVAHT